MNDDHNPLSTDAGRSADDGRIFDVVVIGGGPAGATAAHDLALQGRSVLLLDRAGRIKPCGGAIPPRLIKDFGIPASLLVARATSARMVSPKDERVDIPIENGFVGMVDRDAFDEWLRCRAASCGAERRTGSFERLTRSEGAGGAGCDAGVITVHYETRPAGRGEAGANGTNAASGTAGTNGTNGTNSTNSTNRTNGITGASGASGASGATGRVSAAAGRAGAGRVRARAVIGADGARSQVAKQAVPGAERTRYVFAYHEILRTPAAPPSGFDGSRCDVYYRGTLSPDFYGWVFPHGETMSVGTGSADKGFSLRGAVGDLRAAAGLSGAETLRREGAPLPMKPLPRWDNGRDVVLAGDAAGVVAPASGEGIYYAMHSGRLAAEAVQAFLQTGDARQLATARRRFMKAHGKVFWVLGILQRFWYSSDRRRERFVSICKDRDVQHLTFESYMNKELVRKKPMAHLRIFFKDLAHLFGLARV